MGSWRKSSKSKTDNCVEVGSGPAAIAVRDSRNPGGPVLRFRDSGWAAFVAAVKSGAARPALTRNGGRTWDDAAHDPIVHLRPHPFRTGHPGPAGMTGWRTSSRSANNGACVEVSSWRASSRCSNGTCVEVGTGPAVVGVRDAKAAGKGPVLEFSPQAWTRFLGEVKAP